MSGRFVICSDRRHCSTLVLVSGPSERRRLMTEVKQLLPTNSASQDEGFTVALEKHSSCSANVQWLWVWGFDFERNKSDCSQYKPASSICTDLALERPRMVHVVDLAGS